MIYEKKNQTPEELRREAGERWATIAGRGLAMPPPGTAAYEALTPAQRLKLLVDFYRQDFKTPEDKYPWMVGPVQLPTSRAEFRTRKLGEGEIYGPGAGYDENEVFSTIIHELLHAADWEAKKTPRLRDPESGKHFSFSSGGKRLTKEESENDFEAVDREIRQQQDDLSAFQEKALKRVSDLEDSWLRHLVGTSDRSIAYPILYGEPGAPRFKQDPNLKIETKYEERGPLPSEVKNRSTMPDVEEPTPDQLGPIIELFRKIKGAERPLAEEPLP